MRLALARCLFAPKDLLLLDEPTNHLDMEAILWLENYLRNFPGATLMVSHDQDFLDRCVTHIAHIEDKHVRLYKGDYSSFELQRAYAITLNNDRYKKQQAQIAHTMKFLDRFRFKATKARQAQSRINALERMELLKPIYDQSPLQFHFQSPEKIANPLISLRNISLGYGDHNVIKNISLNILMQQRIGLLGVNGAGKSTFIKSLCRELLPNTGEMGWASGLTIGYFAQHQIDILPLYETPFRYCRLHNEEKSEREILSFLGSFGFSKLQSCEPIAALSGGEKARLALALLIAQNPSLLLLDEPTNHLDLATRRALQTALQSYAGTLIIVCHDRRLLRSLVDELYIIEEGEIRCFDGGIDDYQALRA
jgi:ATP-binding cassette subfamily F protein 3